MFAIRYVNILVVAVIGYFSFVCHGLPSEKDAWPFPSISVNEAINLADGWLYAWDEKDKGMDERWYSSDFKRDAWKNLTIPSVWDMPPGKVPLKIARGVAWFSHKLRLPVNWNGEPVLVFLGAMFFSDIWLDGEYLGSHRGAYTPFSFSLEDKLKPGEEKELVIRIDNRLSNRSIPDKNLGWNAYGGLTREVFLISKPYFRVEDLRTVTKLKSDGTAHLRISGIVVNRSKKIIEKELTVDLNANSKNCAHAELKFSLQAGNFEPFKLDFEITNARLWSPEFPFLHSLEMRWRGDSEPHILLPIGLREIKINGPDFLVNGKRLWLQGFGRHEDLKDFGPCIPLKWNESELERIKAFGANHLRTGHYPQHPSTYAVCDKIGMLVFVEIPAWQLDRAWAQTEQAWDDWEKPQITEMIQWYGNFSSIISWGAANEMGETVEYNKRSIAYISANDPTRIPMIVVASTCNPDLYKLLPMAGRNLHYGWYHSKRVYDGLRNGLAANLKYAEEVDIPIWVAELGAQGKSAAFTGGYNDELRGSETYLDKVVRFGFQYCAVTSERVSGIGVWTWSDFVRNGTINTHGIFGFARENKMVAYTIRNLFFGDLRLFLCEDDSSCQPGGLFHAKSYVFNPKLLELPSGLTIKWRIMHGSKIFSSGKSSVSGIARARAFPVTDISWNIPAELRGLFTLWVELFDANGVRLYTNAVHFGVGEPVEKPGALCLSAVSKDKAVDASVEFMGVNMTVYADPGFIIPLPAGEYDFTVKRGDESRQIKAQIKAGECLNIKAEFSR